MKSKIIASVKKGLPRIAEILAAMTGKFNMRSKTIKSGKEYNRQRSKDELKKSNFE